jgi:hypothetical protein
VRKRLTKFATTFAGLLQPADAAVDTGAQLEDIRHVMLASLSAIPTHTLGLEKTWGAIARAGAAQTLWYLRSDLLALLASHCGEAKARESLDQITQMFRGLVPDGLMGGNRRPKQ